MAFTEFGSYLMILIPARGNGVPQCLIFAGGDAVPLVKKVRGCRSLVFPLENITAADK